MNGMEELTNNKAVKTFLSNNKLTHSLSRYYDGKFLWHNKVLCQYEIKGNELTESSEELSMTIVSKITSLDEAKTCYYFYKCIMPDGKEISQNINATFQKVTADYSQDIIGMWEGVEMTGDETYGDANHRIYYKEDGTYTYYDKVGDSWVPSKNAGNEYNVDGDWLATRWQPTEGADYEYEWWDIVEIKDGTMKWSALREKDNTRYTTTFTWKKVNLPTQEEIETKIIGKWKETIKNGEDVLTNIRIVKSFYSNHAETQSSSRYIDGVYVWFNKAPFRYEVKGNELIESSEETSLMLASKITAIDDTELRNNAYKCITPECKELSVNINTTFQKVTADYSQDIIGMWEGVEMTGDETYGDANHRIEYKADGTYVYYDKDGDDWKLSEDVDNEYNVDGDWLASRWRPKAGEDFEYEWWDIVEIKDGTMKWSALREKGDKTRYTTTFTWKKVQLQ